MAEGQKTRLADLLAEALDRDPGTREEFIARNCAGNAAMGAELRSLIAAAEGAGGFMGEPTAARVLVAGEGASGDEDPGAMIGRYRLIRRLGEGGFGAVFMAEQREPVHRIVALKIIKLGMDTRAVVARFEAERQALAMMDHPNIAKVLDAGATPSGRPYFVMELVRGEPIDRYCDRNRLSPRARLELFAQVCHAVQHAHTKGIIHRDIKPGNVLVGPVDDRPTPKIIDFGIAKATGARLTEKTLFTEFRQMIGTPAYMSPEQAGSSADIDTRTDVYSLGVLLYELLTGATPFDAERLRSAAWGEMQRIIREDDPPRPSTRLSTMHDQLPSVAAQRDTEPARLTAMVRGDLDWIVMRCLEKDRSRRYQTAAALVDEIGRHLGGRPVEAAPPGLRYRARKFVRRHRVMITAAACVAAALIAGVAATGYGLYRAVKAERLAVLRLQDEMKARAEAEAAKDRAERFNNVANAVTEFFTQDLLDLSPRPEGAPEITVRELLDAVPKKIERYFKSDPAVEGIIRERVGQLYRRMGKLDRSTEYLVQAIPLLEKGLGAESKPALSAVQRLGELKVDQARYEEAAALFDKAYRGRLHAYGMEYTMTVNSLTRRGVARVMIGRADEGVADVRKALEYTESKGGRDSRAFVVGALDLIDVLNTTGRAEESLRLCTELLGTVQRKQGPLASLEWSVRWSMASSLLALGQTEEALAQADSVIDILSKSYPEEHPITIDARLLRGRILAKAGRNKEASAELERVYEHAGSVYGSGNADSREAAEQLAAVAEAEGDSASAAKWRERAK